ncbi:MAG: CehA/McbA family metallohydrolase [Verrucomicrobia bacterium]|nr:CehA/McbA family metallohydrolase [Verrucomicrobiota bacterium]
MTHCSSLSRLSLALVLAAAPGLAGLPWAGADTAAPSASPAPTLTGEVLDEATGKLIPSRLYIQHADGRWFFPESAVSGGSAIRYERRNWLNTNAVEYHATLSAHPFRIQLPPGAYTVTAERGKEYRPVTQHVEIDQADRHVRLPLRRWVNLAARGWYSGDTHVHRTLADLPNVMLAEDVNVVFPLTFWITRAFVPPAQSDKNHDTEAAPKLIAVDATHVIWPRNTEYEIFSVGSKPHSLGAVFALNHQTPFQKGVPPLIPFAGQARLEGALLDLDKHDWPWSMALVPLIGVDLYELANNHHWRTGFGLTNWSTPAPAWMNLPNAGKHGTELDWTHYTFQNYYALLNCGFRLRPSAGTANGVHPVPLGFGRVYVHLPGGFSYGAWVKRLAEGRSFVTTGPMLLVKIDRQLPGFQFAAKPRLTRRVTVEGTVLSEQPVEAVDIIRNGQIAARLAPKTRQNRDTAWEARFETRVDLAGSGWLAVRCWEPRADGRKRFAHTAPSYFDVPGQPLKPRKAEAAFLAERVRTELARSRNVLPAEAVAEYERALKVYEDLTAKAE